MFSNFPSDVTLHLYTYIGCSTSKLIREYWEKEKHNSVNWDDYEQNLRSYHEYKYWCYSISATPRSLCNTSMRSICKFKYIYNFNSNG